MISNILSANVISPPGGLHFVDYMIILLSLAASVYLAFHFARGQKSTKIYFEKRFGYFARIYASLGFILAHFSKMGTVLFLLGLAISSFINLDTLVVIWVLGGIIILITLLGGIETIIWLDVAQGFLLITGGLIAFIIVLLSIEGGPVALWEFAYENNRVGFGPFNWDFVNLTFWVMAINGIFYAIQKYGTDQTIIQRYLTAKTNKDAINASLIGVLLSVPVWAVFMFLGTALYGYYNLNADAALKKMGIEKPRIAVNGLNPHAGENGLFGTEEMEFIIPAIEQAKIQGVEVDGPHPPDTIFPKMKGGQYDVVVCMYHDQGHIPTKLLGFQYDDSKKTWKSISGVNITLGLPIIRVSVDHGTAFDKAGKGEANAESMLQAISYAVKFSKNI